MCVCVCLRVYLYACAYVPFKQQLHDFTEASVSTVPCAYFPRIAHEFYCIKCIKRERESEREGVWHTAYVGFIMRAFRCVAARFSEFPTIHVNVVNIIIFISLLPTYLPSMYTRCMYIVSPISLLHMYCENRASCVPDNTSQPKFVITTNKTTSKK